MPAWTGPNSPNPFYSRGNPYGSPYGDTSFQTAPISQIYQQTEPGVAWTMHTAGWGGGLDPFGRFVAGQEQRVEDAYRAAVATNPNLQRPEFFARFGPDYFARLWAQLGPRARGENRALFAPEARWQRWG